MKATKRTRQKVIDDLVEGNRNYLPLYKDLESTIKDIRPYT